MCVEKYAHNWRDTIHKDKPRYLRDNLQVIREVMGEYGEESVASALGYCLENGLYNAFHLKEAAAHYQESSRQQKKPQPVISVLREGVQMGQYDTAAYIPERSRINRYDQIMEP